MEVMDYEVVGIEGWARRQWITAPEKLVVHRGGPWSPESFSRALGQTLEWLKPKVIEDRIWTAKEWRTHQHGIAKKVLQSCYQATLIDQYLKATDNKDILFIEHFRHLPLFLRSASGFAIDKTLAGYRIQKALLEIRDFGNLRSEPQILKLNHTLHVIDNHGPKTPDLPTGMVALFVHPGTLEVHTEPFTAIDARLLDLLGEDRKFTALQLLESAQLEGESIGPCRQRLEFWQKKGLILMGETA